MLIYWAAEARSLVALSFSFLFSFLSFSQFKKGMNFLLILLWCMLSLQCPTNLSINWWTLLTEPCYTFHILDWSDDFQETEKKKVSGETRFNQVSAEAEVQLLQPMAVAMVKRFSLLWAPRECMCALWDPVDTWSGIKWDPQWSSKCHVPTRPLNQTYWSVHTISCPNRHKGQINISRCDWAR